MIYANNFLLDNMFVQFGNTVFHQSVGIPIGTNSAPFIVDLFLYYYESQFMVKLQKDLSKHSLISFFILVYISKLVCFAQKCNNVSGFNDSNVMITEKLLPQGYCFHKLLKKKNALFCVHIWSSKYQFDSLWLDQADDQTNILLDSRWACYLSHTIW